MKKSFLLLLAMVGMFAIGCEGGLNDEENGGTASIPEIELSEQIIETDFEPGSYTVSVISSCSWKAESDSDWIVIKSKTGIAGTNALSFNVKRNEEPKLRKGVITIRNIEYNLIEELYVVQNAFEPKIVVGPNSLNFSTSGGTQEVAITANFEYKVSVSADWVTYTKTNNGIAVSVPNYTEIEKRSTDITIYNKKYNISKIIKVSQGAFVPEIVVKPESLSFASNGGTQEVAITANFEYEISVSADWATYTKTNNGIAVSVPNYTEIEKRSTDITIYNKKYNISKIVKVSQSANEPMITVEPETLTFSANGGEQNVIVTSNIEHVASTEANWLTITKKGDNYTVSASKHSDITTRTADITIYNEKYNIFSTIKVSQKGLGEEEYAKYVIAYTSSDNNIITPRGYGSKIVSNIYENGKGLIIFDAPVTSIREEAFYGCSRLTSITIPNSVTSIGEEAFSRCSSLTSITIPNSVTSIGGSAFSGCSSLTSVHIFDLSAWCKIDFAYYEANPLYNGAKLYLNDSELSQVTIPSDVTEIKKYAFSSCSSLSSVTIGNSVTSIGNQAFSKCSSLTSVTISSSVTSIGDYAFDDCSSLTSITIPDSVTSIGRYAFSDCSRLTSVTIGNSVTSIGERAFYRCSSLTSITIPNSVTSIGNDTFSGCSSLTSVTIGNSVTSIGGSAFSSCSSLTSITIPDSVTSIGRSAFYNCDRLTSVTIPNSVTSIEEDTFYKCSSLTSVTIGNSVTSIGDDAFYKCSSLTSVTIGNSVTSIGKSAFSNCSSLTSITIPDSVTSIGENTFYNCSSLTSITIPDSVTSIGNFAFESCSSLTSVTIGNSVTSIGNCAFRSCSSLSSVTIGNSVTSIGGSAFSGCSSLTSVHIFDLSAWCKIDFANSEANPLYRGAKLYLNDSELSQVTIPSDISQVKPYTFYKCSSLASITIPNSVTSIGDYAFDDCSSLTSVSIGNRVTSIGVRAFYHCMGLTSVSIGSSVTSIGKEAFYYCTSLKSVYIFDLSAWCKIDFANYEANPLYNGAKLYLNDSELSQMSIPSGITEIKPYTFYKCSSLTSVTIGNSVISIGQSAFAYCSSLTSVTIGNSVTSIGESTFSNCSSLKSVTIGNSVTSIGDTAFRSCSSLTRVHIFDLSAWCKIDFAYDDSNPLYNGAKLYLNGSELSQVTIPSDVTEIKKYAFNYCRSLTSVTIPNSVTSIGGYAFNYCRSLTSITIGNSVTSIGNCAFQYCSSLTSVYCKPTTPPTGSLNMFDNNASERMIYVPTTSVDAYKAKAYWQNYADYIVGYDF